MNKIILSGFVILYLLLFVDSYYKVATTPRFNFINTTIMRYYYILSSHRPNSIIKYFS